MKATAIGGILLLLSLPSWGEPLKIEDTSADIDALGSPDVLITLSDGVPTELEEQVLDPANYEVVATAPLRGGDVVPAVEGTAIPISQVSFQETEQGIDRSVIVLHMSGFTYGQGEVTVQDMVAGSSSLEGATETWSVTERFEIEPTLARHQSLRFQGQTAVIDFSFTYGGLQWNGKNGASRISATLEGSASLGTPEDVEEEPEAEADASEEVADFFKLSVLSTTFAGKGRLHSYGLVARSTAQFEGLEAVGTYQFGWLFGGTEVEQIERSVDLHGTVFAGTSLEAGYRRGDAEWTSLTQAAPDRGDIVARVGGVLEWGPRLGPINRDLGEGLRFFVRGRGWADWADDEEGEGDVRFRGFLDSELFYNVSDELRVFLRWENGYLLPDLSQRHRQTFVGVGTAF